MTSPDVSIDGSLETQSDGSAVEGVMTRSRDSIDKATDGACGIVGIAGAGSRFLTKPIATGIGEVWRSARETIEAGSNAARGGKKEETSDSLSA